MKIKKIILTKSEKEELAEMAESNYYWLLNQEAFLEAHTEACPEGYDGR